MFFFKLFLFTNFHFPIFISYSIKGRNNYKVDCLKPLRALVYKNYSIAKSEKAITNLLKSLERRFSLEG
ncbi:hypothetical protein, partial [Qipengyuania thermophila]|uniref:hypothetical protein n=1 Tax=Qipengyuania thermophila TaxID=2509361 RepID=UPI001F208D1D